MSRIILTKYQTGQEQFVVGWDHPCGGAFWQEFNLEPEDKEYPEGWQEVLRDGGFMPGIPLDRFEAAVPEDLRVFITPLVMKLLKEHSEDRDSGYNTQSIDLTLIP